MNYSDLAEKFQTNRTLFRTMILSKVNDAITSKVNSVMDFPLTDKIEVEVKHWSDENIPLIKSTMESMDFRNIHVRRTSNSGMSYGSYDRYYFEITIKENDEK